MNEKEQIESLKNITKFVKDISPTDRLEVYQDIARIVDFLITDKKLHERPSPETIKMFEEFSKSIISIQEHLKRQDDNFENLKKTLEPISETFDTGIRIKKWGWGLLMLVSVASGLIWGWFNFLKPIIQKMV